MTIWSHVAAHSLLIFACYVIFTALHVMQTLYSNENSVCLSVCPSITRVDCDKTEERSVKIFIPY